MAAAAGSNGRIVFVTAFPGVGKTTTGDYLASYHGFHHIDGDVCVRGSHGPSIQQAFGHWLKDQAAPIELWHPCYLQLCDTCLSAAAEHRDIVISHVIYRREVRDFFRERLGEHGLVFLKLECDLDIIVQGVEKRAEAYLKTKGQTLEDYWNGPQPASVGGGVCFREKYGEYSFENYKKMQLEIYLQGMQPFAHDESDTITVDITSRDNSCCFERINAALGLPARTTDVDMGMLQELSRSRW